MSLRPDLGESHLAAGYVHYSIEADYDAALASFEEAARLLPNNADVLRAISVAKRRKGLWEDAAAVQRRAIELDPRNLRLFADLNYTLQQLGRLRESAQLVERALLLAPGDAGWQTRKANALFVAGDLDGAIRLLERLPTPLPQLGARGLLDTLLLFQRRYPEVIADVRDVIAHPDPELLDVVGDYYTALTLAQERSGDLAGMKASCRQGIAALKSLRSHGSDTPGLLMSLATLQAQLGEREAARAEIDKGLARTRGDALEAPRMLLTQAIVLMMLGDHDGALQSLERIRSSAPPGFLPSAVLRLGPDLGPAARRGALPGPGRGSGSVLTAGRSRVGPGERDGGSRHARSVCRPARPRERHRLDSRKPSRFIALRSVPVRSGDCRKKFSAGVAGFSERSRLSG